MNAREALARGLAAKRHDTAWEELRPWTRACFRTLALTVERILAAAGYTILRDDETHAPTEGETRLSLLLNERASELSASETARLEAERLLAEARKLLAPFTKTFTVRGKTGAAFTLRDIEAARAFLAARTGEAKDGR